MQKRLKHVLSGDGKRVVRGKGLITTNLLDYICRLGPCQDFLAWEVGANLASTKLLSTFNGHNLSVGAVRCKRYAHPETRFSLATEWLRSRSRS